MRAKYSKPEILFWQSYETSALSCGKQIDMPPGAYWHLSSAYDTFTGHFGSGFGDSESVSASAGVGYGPGGTSQSYLYSGLCGNWITYSS